MITLTHEQVETLLEDAAERGAKKALASVGLDYVDAARDVMEWRFTMGAMRTIRNGFFKQVGAIVAVFLVGVLCAYIAEKIGALEHIRGRLP